jgi:hypothetical protein
VIRFRFLAGSGFAAAIEANVASNEVDVKAVAAKIAAGENDAAARRVFGPPPPPAELVAPAPVR